MQPRHLFPSLGQGSRPFVLAQPLTTFNVPTGEYGNCSTPLTLVCDKGTAANFGRRRDVPRCPACIRWADHRGGDSTGEKGGGEHSSRSSSPAAAPGIATNKEARSESLHPAAP